MKITTWKFLGLGLAALIAFSPAAHGQMGQQTTDSRTQGMGATAPALQVGQQSSQGTTQTQTPPGQAQTPPAALPPVDPVEEAAYKKITAKGGDPKVVTAEAKDFLTKYPKSRYAANVLTQLASAWLQLGDKDRAAAFAQQAVGLNPASPDAVSLLAYLSSRMLESGPGTLQDRIKATETYAHQGIQLLNAMQKPPEMPDADFNATRNEKLSMCHSAMGLAYLNDNKPDEAAQELAEATHLSATPDPVDLFLLGFAYENTKHYTEAAAAYAACAKDPQIGDRCSAGLKDVKGKQ